MLTSSQEVRFGKLKIVAQYSYVAMSVMCLQGQGMSVRVSIMSFTECTLSASKGADGIKNSHLAVHKGCQVRGFQLAQKKISLPLTAVCTHRFNEIFQALQ